MAKRPKTSSEYLGFLLLFVLCLPPRTSKPARPSAVTYVVAGEDCCARGEGWDAEGPRPPRAVLARRHEDTHLQ
jgi:hypothetical protein